MSTVDIDQVQSEQGMTLFEFLKYYNSNLPADFPRASLPLLRKFRNTYPALFSNENGWSAEKHRKKFMDWPMQRNSTPPQ